mmetsp:Transcript_21695/g.40556  ORF Transcript_21695/g.40556 Transcript_21695/m.40556 type:complete len:565 (+) Transcript_21695:49-1743(+)
MTSPLQHEVSLEEHDESRTSVGTSPPPLLEASYDYHAIGDEEMCNGGPDGHDSPVPQLDDIVLDWKSEEQRKELKVWWSLAWPTMILFFSTQSYTFVDMSFLGHLGNDDNSSQYLAASSQAGIVFDVSVAIFLRGFLQVLTIVGSQAYGANKHRLVGEWLGTCMILLYIFVIPVAVFWYYTADILRIAFGLKPELYDLVKRFSRFSMLRMYPMLTTFAIRQFCLVLKIVTPLLFISFTGAILNVIFNQVFIYGAFGVPGLGFDGSPLATAVTNTVVMIFTVYYIFYYRKDTAKYWPGWSRKMVEWSRIKEFLRQGIPLTLGTCLEEFQIQAVSAMAIQVSHRTTDGSYLIAAHNGLLSFFILSMSFQWGSLKATSLRAGYHIGAQNAGYAKLTGKMGFILSLVVSIVTSIALFALRHQIGYLFSNDPRVAKQVAILIIPISLCLVYMSFFYVAMAMIDAQGRPAVVAVAFLFGAWCVSVPGAYLIGIHFEQGLVGLWAGLNMGYFTTTLILCIALYKSNWKSILQDAKTRNALSDEGVSPPRSPFRSPELLAAESGPHPSPLFT